MRVLAFDPGFDRLGVAILDNEQGIDSLIHSECIITDRASTFNDRLHTLGSAVEILLQTYQPDCIAIETLFFNKNIKTAIHVAEARGTLLYLAKKAGCAIYEFGPQEIKIAITGYGKSDKTAVLAMVRRLIKDVPVSALDDEYDAIAIGITCLAQYGRGR